MAPPVDFRENIVGIRRWRGRMVGAAEDPIRKKQDTPLPPGLVESSSWRDFAHES